MTKSAGNCGFGHIYWRILNGKLHFLCSVKSLFCQNKCLVLIRINLETNLSDLFFFSWEKFRISNLINLIKTFWLKLESYPDFRLSDIRSIHRRCSVKRCSQQFCKIYRKTPVAESLFNKAAGLTPVTLLKKRLWRRCFPGNFVKFLRTPFDIEHLRCLLVKHLR